MSFPPKVQEDALVAAGRHCCLCHRFCGLKIELHHIRQKSAGGQDTFENCLPVCFDCHADMRSYDHKHPKGTKYTEPELTRHRDLWYSKVKGSPAPSYNAESREVDRQVFLALVELIPYQRTMSLLQNHSFGAPFRASILREFDRFVVENDNPAMEFLDSDLEGLRMSLRESINQFSHDLATQTWRLGSDMQAVPEEWSEKQPARFERVVKQLNGKATETFELYCQLVREARRRLGVITPEAAA